MCGQSWACPEFVDTPEVRENMKMNRRRLFTDEFKTEAVRRVHEEGRQPAAVARELDVPRQLLSKWLERASELGAPGAPPPLKEDERAELERLRQEVARLREQKVILKKAAAFFAKESL